MILDIVIWHFATGIFSAAVMMFRDWVLFKSRDRHRWTAKCFWITVFGGFASLLLGIWWMLKDVKLFINIWRNL
jgi:hypothetical protein